MIRGFDLFGRDALSPNERLIVKTANETALQLFKKRFSPVLRDNWDINVKELTLENVEHDVIQAIRQTGDSGRSIARNADSAKFRREKEKAQME